MRVMKNIPALCLKFKSYKKRRAYWYNVTFTLDLALTQWAKSLNFVSALMSTILDNFIFTAPTKGVSHVTQEKQYISLKQNLKRIDKAVLHNGFPT